MDRLPIVAGRFYDASPEKLEQTLAAYMPIDSEKMTERTVLAMVPHAGYVFSGATCGQTLGQAHLESTLVLLGPNHTGRGAACALWPDGVWKIPGAFLSVDTALSATLLNASSLISADTEAHMEEHSLEVLLPFLHRINPKTTIVSISIALRSYAELEKVGQAIGQALRDFERPVSIVVSSDMSHYISDDAARKKDALALKAVLDVDPEGVYNTVMENDISMCGVYPMTVGLVAAGIMGANKGELVHYTTSGDVSGDFEQVVGYAGVLVS